MSSNNNNSNATMFSSLRLAETLHRLKLNVNKADANKVAIDENGKHITGTLMKPHEPIPPYIKEGDRLCVTHSTDTDTAILFWDFDPVVITDDNGKIIKNHITAPEKLREFMKVHRVKWIQGSEDVPGESLHCIIQIVDAGPEYAIQFAKKYSQNPLEIFGHNKRFMVYGSFNQTKRPEKPPSEWIHDGYILISFTKVEFEKFIKELEEARILQEVKKRNGGSGGKNNNHKVNASFTPAGQGLRHRALFNEAHRCFWLLNLDERDKLISEGDYKILANIILQNARIENISEYENEKSYELKNACESKLKSLQERPPGFLLEDLTPPCTLSEFDMRVILYYILSNSYDTKTRTTPQPPIIVARAVAELNDLFKIKCDNFDIFEMESWVESMGAGKSPNLEAFVRDAILSIHTFAKIKSFSRDDKYNFIYFDGYVWSENTTELILDNIQRMEAIINTPIKVSVAEDTAKRIGSLKDGRVVLIDFEENARWRNHVFIGNNGKFYDFLDGKIKSIDPKSGHYFDTPDTIFDLEDGIKDCEKYTEFLTTLGGSKRDGSIMYDWYAKNMCSGGGKKGKALIIHGMTDTYKSTSGEIIQRLLHPNKVVKCSLANIETDPFAKANMADCIINIQDEIEKYDMPRSLTQFKDAVTMPRGPYRKMRKNRQTHAYRWPGMFLCSNKISDLIGGLTGDRESLFNRLNIIYANPDIKKRLWWRQGKGGEGGDFDDVELKQILHMLLRRAHEITLNPDSINEQTADEAQAAYEKESLTKMYEFKAKFVNETPGVCVSLDDFRHVFNTYFNQVYKKDDIVLMARSAGFTVGDDRQFVYKMFGAHYNFNLSKNEMNDERFLKRVVLDIEANKDFIEILQSGGHGKKDAEKPAAYNKVKQSPIDSGGGVDDGDVDDTPNIGMVDGKLRTVEMK